VPRNPFVARPHSRVLRSWQIRRALPFALELALTDLRTSQRGFLSACRLLPTFTNPEPTRMPSRPREFHPEPLTDPDLILSHHPARAIGRRLPPSVEFRAPPGRTWLVQLNADDLPPLLQPHYRAFSATTGQSAPLRRIGTFGLAVDAACAFSLSIASKVLTFHIRAWPGFAPPTRRLPPGPSQASPRLIPEDGSPPGFDIT
jgi:hypothetical protein